MNITLSELRSERDKLKAQLKEINKAIKAKRAENKSSYRERLCAAKVARIAARNEDKHKMVDELLKKLHI